MKFNRLFVATVSFLLLSASSSAIAGIINLGAAANYNAFIHQDFSATSSDVEGRLAAGGDVSISNYSVNIKNGTQLYADTNDSPALVVGGDLSFSSGQVAGNVSVAGNYTPTGTGTITNGTLNAGGVSPIDFDAEFDNLMSISADLALLTANGTATDLWSSQHLVGAGMNSLANDLHIFNLDASDMLFNDYLLSAVDQGDMVIFNIAGSDISTSWGNFGGSDSSLVDMSENILFNFYEAETLNINAALYGSILAPKASVQAPHGVIWGQVIADSWHGNTQINDNSFAGHSSNSAVTVPVPEPTTLAIFFLGVMCLVAGRFKKQ
jgi:choice-of-anchor A domain-containing protein